ncbi:serine/threonine-protein kinase RIO3 [Culicoides brevitarsis]|uniref:serine/threonine-protein kinase RIO3 n=1 Tax=Culicoides brevitarsis TaxID=469753 RepID=UPI00307CA612
MTSPWKIIEPAEADVSSNLSEIMNEEYAKRLQEEEFKKVKGPKVPIPSIDVVDAVPHDVEPPSKPSGLPPEVLEALKDEPDFQKIVEMDSDWQIAQTLQEMYIKEHDNYLKKVEKANNKNSKVQISYSKYRIAPEELQGEDSDAEDNQPIPYEERKDWDRFETNEKEFSKISKKKNTTTNVDGEIKTKHDAEIAGRRNACKVMSFPPEFETGDAGSFDMKLNNTVFNQLKQSVKQTKKVNRAFDRKEAVETAVMGLDEATRLILYKMINNQLLESVDGVISTGKEAVILHAETDPNGESNALVPKEVAIKIFSTTLNEFKQRDRYIKDDYRFKGRFSKQNSHTIINMWAEKEMHNLQRLKKAGILCPDVIVLKKHILVMSFIGRNTVPALKIKEARLSDAEWSVAYEETLQIMHKMYNDARLVHADFSEYNILWYNDQIWVIDVAQSVEPQHPGALEFLMRDCDNVVTFFSKKGVPNVLTREELFFNITGLDPLTHNANQLERIHMKGPAAPHIANNMMQNDDEIPDRFKPLVYPFELAWEKVEEMKKNSTPDNFDALQQLRYQEI